MRLANAFFLVLGVASCAVSHGERQSKHSGDRAANPAFIKSVTGPLLDTKCDVEAVERANSRQLSLLLADVLETSFFRKFRLVDNKCPFWESKSVNVADEGKGKNNQDEPSCAETSAAAGLAEPACSLKGVSLDPFSAAMGSSSSSSSSSFSSSGFSSSAPKHSIPEGPTTDAFEGIVSHASQNDESGSCSDPTSQEFWLDMCDGFTNSTGTAKWVDLKENNERWTGYNGSHVWKAIYSENCFSRFGELRDMCYEERVLYKLLSGMHASVNIHIAQKFFPPSKRMGRTKWMPNPALFKQHFAAHPERLMNVHFAFVVLLRALVKAKPVLYDFDYVNHLQPRQLQADLNEPEKKANNRTKMLMRRLLDSDILDSCSGVFSAFDESLLFSDGESPSTSVALKTSFKGVFQNVSSLLDCVTCQKCKLHGKVALMGLGTALKILLSPPDLFRSKRGMLTPIEVVALVNSIGKFSSSITAIDDLSRQSWEEDYFAGTQKAKGVTKQAIKSGKASGWQGESDAAAKSIAKLGEMISSKLGALKNAFELNSKHFDVVDKALEVIAKKLSGPDSVEHLTSQEEDVLIDRVMEEDAGTMLLIKNFADRPTDLMRHLRRRSLLTRNPKLWEGATKQEARADLPVDAVVVGSGLSGLTAAVTLVDRGANVVIVEKNAFSGGNSAYASSGLNAVERMSSTSGNASDADSVEAYTMDTLKSSGGSQTASVLAPVLTKGSFDALTWIRNRVGLPMLKKSQLGGHRYARTWRPENGMAGSEIIFALNKIVKHLQKTTGRLRIMYKTRMDRVLTTIEHNDGTQQERANGVSVVDIKTGKASVIEARNVIIATGGYAADRSPETSLLAKHRPDLLHFASTNGAFATGDGHKAAVSVGAATTEMDHVQVHPTAFVDPRRISSSGGQTGGRKTLCAELLRGVGGLLLDRRGRRFANELGKRDYVVAQMKMAAKEIAENVDEAANAPKAKSKGRLAFAIILNSVSANIADKHVPHYTQKGLLTRVENLEELSEWMTDPSGVFHSLPGVDAATIGDTFDQYMAIAKSGGADEFGKSNFENAAAFASGPYWVGVVTPALHYTMGGISISETGQALRKDGSAFAGLYVAGEATGGVHGVNRLGGNALTECVVFGRAVGNEISIGDPMSKSVSGSSTQLQPEQSSVNGKESVTSTTGSLPLISLAELSRHNSPESGGVWTAIDGKVYDMTDFLEEHPAGPESILDVGGKDGTRVFLGVHTLPMLEEEFEAIGILSN